MLNNENDTSDFINDTSSIIIDTSIIAVDTSFNTIDTSINVDNFMLDNEFGSIKGFKPDILEYNFKYKYFENEDEFKFKISNSDSAYIYLFSYDSDYFTVTPIAKDNNKEIFLNKKRPDIILPESNYLSLGKSFFP